MNSSNVPDEVVLAIARTAIAVYQEMLQEGICVEGAEAEAPHQALAVWRSSDRSPGPDSPAGMLPDS